MKIVQDMQVVQHRNELLHVVFAELFQNGVDLGFYRGELNTADLTDLWQSQQKTVYDACGRHAAS